MNQIDLQYISATYKQIYFFEYKYQSHRFNLANRISKQFLIQLIAMFTFIVYQNMCPQHIINLSFENNKQKFLLIYFLWIIIKPVTSYINFQIPFIQFLLILIHGFCCTLVFEGPIIIWGIIILIYYNVGYRLLQEVCKSQKSEQLLITIAIAQILISAVIYGVCYGLNWQCKEQKIIAVFLILDGIIIYGVNTKKMISFILKHRQNELQKYKCEEFSIELFFHFLVIMKLTEQLVWIVRF